MNLLAARVVLRPRRLVDVLELAAPLCWRDRHVLGPLAAAVLISLGAVAAGLRLGLHARWTVVWAATLEATVLVDGVFTLALGELLFNEARDVRTGTIARRFVRALPRVAGACLARQLLAVVSVVMVVGPAIFAAQRAFVVEAMLLERVPWKKAVARSRALTRGALSGALGLCLATLLLPALGAVIGDVLDTAICGFVLQVGHPTGSLAQDGGSLFSVAGALLAVPIGAAMRFLGYIDRRTRTEGWDIQLRFTALADGAAAHGRSKREHAA